jgi:hypothetical protein
MRDDLLAAQAAVDWAVAEIPRIQSGFLEWQQKNQYPVVQEPHPDGGGDAAVVYDKSLPLIYNAWAGAIVNSLRSSLDLLAAALAYRNGKKPNPQRHFPIFDSLNSFIDPLTGIDGVERKKWLSDSERTAIKALRPYKGGDDTIWPLHELDILRKHERLISADPEIGGYFMMGRHIVVSGAKAIQRLENKTILRRLAPGEVLNASQGNTLLAVHIMLNEAPLGIANEEAITTLRRFAKRCDEIISLFDR